MVMFECGAGKQVFAELSKQPMALIMRLIQGSRPSFPEGVASPAYRDLTEKCWVGDPDFRPTSDSVATELAKIYQDLP